MSLAIITGSSGLVGSEAVNFFHDKGFEIVGIDNNLRGGEKSALNFLIKQKVKYLNCDLCNQNEIRNKCSEVFEKLNIKKNTAQQKSKPIRQIFNPEFIKNPNLLNPLFKRKIVFLPKRAGERYTSTLTKKNLSNKIFRYYGKIDLKNYINNFIKKNN